MWPFIWSVPPEVSAYRLSKSHWNQLNKASTELAHAGAILVTLGGIQHDCALVNFPESQWPAFTLRDIDALMRKYNLPAGVSLPAADATKMFIEVRDFAFEMRAVMSTTYEDMRYPPILASIYPASWTWPLLPQGEPERVLAKWGNISVREGELQQWLEWAAVRQTRPDQMIRSVNVFPAEERECNPGHSCRRRRGAFSGSKDSAS